MKLLKKCMVFVIIFGSFSTQGVAVDFSLDDGINETEMVLMQKQLQNELQLINEKLRSRILNPEVHETLEKQKAEIVGALKQLKVAEWWHKAGKKGKAAMIIGACAAVGGTIFAIWALSKLWTSCKENKKAEKKKKENRKKKRELAKLDEELEEKEELLEYVANTLEDQGVGALVDTEDGDDEGAEEDEGAGEPRKKRSPRRWLSDWNANRKANRVAKKAARIERRLEKRQAKAARKRERLGLEAGEAEEVELV